MNAGRRLIGQHARDAEARTHAVRRVDGEPRADRDGRDPIFATEWPPTIAPRSFREATATRKGRIGAVDVCTIDKGNFSDADDLLQMSVGRKPIMPASLPDTLAQLNRRIAAAGPLVAGATQPVFGEGPLAAMIAFVGEQPGDEEDRAGKPFVGPAGRLLDRALAEVGIDRDAVYVTNAVKHFKFVQRGKRRIHQKPTVGEIKHYRGWLMQEIGLVHPRLVVALGATAVHALTGKALPIARHRGPATFDNLPGYITVHPSYLLRIPDQDARQAAYASFLDDLRRIGQLAGGAGSPTEAEADKISEKSSKRDQ